ncbi:hypothetical protein BJX62DRAFT_240090 [Aspergillus germanicus]
MSGLEVAGVVLAILPLVVNQLENYVQGLETLKSFRNRTYRRDLQRYLNKTRTHRPQFLNTLEQVLEDAVNDEDEVSELINNPTGPLWGDNTNNLLQTIVEQAQYREDSRTKRKRSEKPLLRYRALRCGAGSLYNAFVRGKCWKCICRDTPHIHFRLDSTSINDRSDNKALEVPRFKIVTGSGIADVHGQSSWAWDEIEAEFLMLKSVEDTQQGPQLHLTLTSPQASPNAKIKRKQVKFAVVAAPLDAIRCASPTPTPKSPLISDFCATLLASRSNLKDAGAIGVLRDEANPIFEHRVYFMKEALSAREFKSLKELLRPLNLSQLALNNQPFLTRRDRLYLAANLACNVLQLHATG